MNVQNRRHLHFHLKTHSRGKGRSAPRALAYVLRDYFENPRTGTTHDCRRNGKLAPLAAGIAGWSEGPEELAAAAVLAEKRRDAVEAREIVAALPNEFSDSDAGDVVQFLADLLARRFRVAVVWALHPRDSGEGEPNLHAHLVFTTRRVIDGKLCEKTREWDDRKQGGKLLKALRITWGEIVNERLSELGLNANVEMRSFAELGEDRVATKHRGEHNSAIRRQPKRRPFPEPQVARLVASLSPPSIPIASKRRTLPSPTSVAAGREHQSQGPSI